MKLYKYNLSMLRDFGFLLVVAFVFLMVSCDSVSKKNEVIPIEDFFAKSDKSNFKISPNGDKIAYLGLHDHCKNIFILDLINKDSSKQLTYQSDMNVQYYFWADDQTIVFSNTQNQDDSLRLYTIDVETERRQALLKTANYKLRWLYPNKSFNGGLLATTNERDSSVFDLYRVYLDGRPKEMVDKNPGNIINWFASADGQVRLALTSDSVQETLLYRPSEDQVFKQVYKSGFETSVIPLGYYKNSTTHIYALSNIGRDKLSLVEFNTSTGEEIKEIFKSPNVDVNKEGYSALLNEMMYASSTVDRKKLHFFNDSYKKAYDQIKKKFPNTSIDFLDVDSSLSHFVFKNTIDVQPNDVYYYNSKTNDIQLLAESNQKFEENQLQPMESIVFNARDNKEIHGYITYPPNKRKNCPVVVLVHDGPSKRDFWEYNTEVQFLANRGYAVFQVNYRGSTGYGKEFWSSGFKQWGGKIQEDITDGVTWLIHEGIADKERIAIMGSGFGGYSALHAACFNSTLYSCAISSSGFTNLFTYFKEIPPYLKPYVQMYYQIIGNPETESELFKSISPLFHADQVTMPLLIFQGGRDKYSSATDVDQFVQKLKQNKVNVQYIYNEEEGRRFKNEENLIAYYQEIEQFLSENLK
ncbi:S9 family peptidase [Sphingobacterium hungaricum]